MEKKLGLKVISSAALAGLLFTAAPVLPADALTENYAQTVTKVTTDEDQALGTLVIKEDVDSDAFFSVNDVITVTLPAGVEYNTDVASGPSVTGATYISDNSDQYVGVEGGVEVAVIATGDNFITLEVKKAATNQGTGKIFVKYPSVDIDSDVTGDIKVQIEADGTVVKEESVTLARVFGGDTVATVSDVKTIGLDSEGKIGTIRLSEATKGKLKNGGKVKLTLPKDYEWKAVKTANGKTTYSTSESDLEIVGTSGLNYKDAKGLGSRTLELTIDRATSTSSQAGFLSFSNLGIYVPDDAKNGDEVEVTVDGSDVTKEDIVIAKVGDFDFKIETKGDIPTVIAGKIEQEVIEFSIDDVIKGSWLDNRTVKLELPSWAEFANGTDADKILKGGKLNSDKNEVRFTVPEKADGKAKFDKMEVNIDADAPEGDLVLTITGSQGIDEEVVIAKVLPPFKVTAEKPEFVIGVQNQQLGDITITETEEEALVENKWIIVKAPKGMEFADTPTVKVTDGDIEIDDEDIDDNFFAFRIDSESAKKASEITISDIEVTLDRTVPVGDVTFEIFMTTNDAINGTGDFKDKQFTSSTKFSKALDKDSYEEVTDVVVGTVVTPVQGENKSVVMNIGSTLYTVDGATKVMDVAPQVIDGRTFTPVRYVAESLGAEVAYDEATKTATLTKGETVVEFVLGSSTYTLNGQAQTMDVAAQVVNGRTMLPARYVAQAFGYEVGFDPASKTVVISK